MSPLFDENCLDKEKSEARFGTVGKKFEENSGDAKYLGVFLAIIVIPICLCSAIINCCFRDKPVKCSSTTKDYKETIKLIEENLALTSKKEPVGNMKTRTNVVYPSVKLNEQENTHGYFSAN